MKTTDRRTRLVLIVFAMAFLCVPLVSCGGGGGGGGKAVVIVDEPITPSLGMGSHIIFTRDTPSGGQNLYMVPVNGGDEVQLTTHTTERIALLERYGSRVIFQSFFDPDGNGNLYSLNVANEQITALTNFQPGEIVRIVVELAETLNTHVVLRTEIAGISNLWAVPVTGSSANLVNLSNKSSGRVTDTIFHFGGTTLVYDYDANNDGSTIVESVSVSGGTPKVISRAGNTATYLQAANNHAILFEREPGGAGFHVAVDPGDAVLSHQVLTPDLADTEIKSAAYASGHGVYIMHNDTNDNDNLYITEVDGSSNPAARTATSSGELMEFVDQAFWSNDVLFVQYTEDDPQVVGNQASADLRWTDFTLGATVLLTGSATTDGEVVDGFAELDVRARTGDDVYFSRKSTPSSPFIAQTSAFMSDVRLDDGTTLPANATILGTNRGYGILRATRQDAFNNEFVNVYSYLPDATNPDVDKLTDTFLDEEAKPFQLISMHFGDDDDIVYLRGADFFRVLPGAEVGLNDVNGIEIGDNDTADSVVIHYSDDERFFFTTNISSNLFYVEPRLTERVQLTGFDPTQVLETTFRGSAVYAANGTHVVFGVSSSGNVRINSSGLGFRSPNPKQASEPLSSDSLTLLLY